MGAISEEARFALLMATMDIASRGANELTGPIASGAWPKATLGACLTHASTYQDLPLRSFQIPFHAGGSGQCMACTWGE